MYGEQREAQFCDEKSLSVVILRMTAEAKVAISYFCILYSETKIV